MGEQYPKRDSHFAHKFTRLVMKSCAAMDIGQQACLLLVYIAHTEDAARYRGAVRFWNEQLLSVLGFRSPKQLTQARERAVAAGWLHYHRAGTREIGKYWVLIPPKVQHLGDDLIEPIEPGFVPNTEREIKKEPGDSFRIRKEKRNESTVIRSEYGMESGTRSGTRSGKLSNPSPKPNPISRRNRFTDADMQTSQFIWGLIQTMQPERKKPSLNKWAESIRLMRERDDRTDQQIRELFAWCNRDEFWRTNILSPSKLREKFDDLQLRRGHSPGSGNADDWPAVQKIVRETYSPDVGNSEDVQARLTTEQFRAVKAIGLSQVASANEYDKATPAAYRSAMQRGAAS